jgi:hypothetical protein
MHTNFAKSTITPIHCNSIDLDALSVNLSCHVAKFRVTTLKYRCLTSIYASVISVQAPTLDKLRNKVKGWIQGSFSIDA